MYQIDLYNKALEVGTDYSAVVDMATYRLPVWFFALIHKHDGVGATTLTLTIQYSHNKWTWVDGKELLTTEAKGSGIVQVQEGTGHRCYVARYLRFKMVVATADASEVFLSLGIT